MAVYTRFGSLLDVHRAVRADGFARLGAVLEALPATDDPVADLVAAALTYLDFAVAEPHLYRTMTIDRPPPKEHDTDPDPGEVVFTRLTGHVRRCLDAGRFRGDSTLVGVWSAQLWSMQHGMATLVLADTVEPAHIRFVLQDMAERLCRGYGDDPVRAHRSVTSATTATSASTARDREGP
ncbi:TetR-like C-terminal domain-containing protein [Pseudonocardia alni]|uniref:TetR-like C-terminal domain-containing protein n=1 Tax=Pseudonocardia alni TaxID=33907 RepID=UPI00386DBBE6